MASWPEFRPVPLLEALSGHGVDFVVIGGVAMILHGSSRTTRDLDICYDTDPANLEALGATMAQVRARLRGVEEPLPFVPDALTLRRMSILTLTSDDGSIDLLVCPPGAPPYRKLRDRAERSSIGGIAILVASLDDLESMKRAAGRPKDLLDLEEIEVIRRLRRRIGR